MRDLALLLMLLGFVSLSLWRPWLGAVGLVVMGSMHPQAFGGEALGRLPLYKILFVTTCAAAAIHFWRQKRWPTVYWDWRVALVLLLGVDFVFTSMFGLLPYTSRDRLLEIGLLVLPWFPILLLIDAREKFVAMLVATALGMAMVALKGGFWAVMTGFQDRVYGPPGSQIGGNNEFAVALAMTIPLLVFWLRQVKGRAMYLVVMGLIVFCYVSALTSWSRGGVVTLAVMSALLIWHSRRKYLAIPFLLLGVGLAFVNFPEKWHERMGTLASYQQDQSFQGRVWAWQRGLEYVREDPLTGVGFDGWKEVNIHMAGQTPTALDWHSAYIEMLVEHGVPGLALWLGLLLGTLVSLSVLVSRGRAASTTWVTDAAAMLRASLVAYAVGGLTLGTAYWELYYLLLAFSILCSRLAAVEFRPPVHDTAVSKILTTPSGRPGMFMSTK